MDQYINLGKLSNKISNSVDIIVFRRSPNGDNATTVELFWLRAQQEKADGEDAEKTNVQDYKETFENTDQCNASEDCLNNVLMNR